ncbi:MAG: hypothetical protein HF982_10760 [Desulfobacteraceae bacterium]|nr:hypothetical protein [Desulfobacteraceae bacterium]MBC2720046.1 hypothetical protein [Desulfobacteraceae bacterium]
MQKKLDAKAESEMVKKVGLFPAELSKAVKEAETAVYKKDTSGDAKIQAQIAVKAIDGASGARTLSAVSEIALEQAKKPEISK